MCPVVLIVYAVKEEHVLLKSDTLQFEYCQTGVGKVNAALAVIDAIEKHHPQLVVNLATAGAVVYPIGSIQLCAKFVDRDMEKLTAFGVPSIVDNSKDASLLSILDQLKADSVCNTGDTFLTSMDGTGDVFDMETYAIAMVCSKRQVPFVAVKYVTDIIGQNSVSDWAHKLADARLGLESYMHQHFLKNLKL